MGVSAKTKAQPNPERHRLAGLISLRGKNTQGAARSTPGKENGPRTYFVSVAESLAEGFAVEWDCIEETHPYPLGVVVRRHAEIIEAAHEDLKKPSHGGPKGRKRGTGRKGRSGDFSSETIVRTRKKAALEYSFLHRCFQAIRPTTWKRINELLGLRTEQEEKIDATVIRTDTTVVEANIHWPKVLAGDKGFCPDGKKYAESAEQVETLAIPRRMRDFADKVLAVWQMFRAGIEGTISGLKRAFRLARCYYRGFQRFQGSIGLGVFAHNLVVLARQGLS